MKHLTSILVFLSFLTLSQAGSISSGFGTGQISSGFGTGQITGGVLSPAAAAGGCVNFANDTFTGVNGTLLAAHVPDLGTSWTVQTGSTGDWAISGNAVKDNTGTGPYDYIGVNSTNANYTVQADVKTSANFGGGPAARMSTTAQTSYFAFWNNGASEWDLDKIVGGTTTNLIAFVGDSPNGVFVTVKIQITDAVKTLFTSGVSRGTSGDNAITPAGRAGVNASGVTSDLLDNWSACQ